jgi:hypothetical protein
MSSDHSYFRSWIVDEIQPLSGRILPRQRVIIHAQASKSMNNRPFAPLLPPHTLPKGRLGHFRASVFG